MVILYIIGLGFLAHWAFASIMMAKALRDKGTLNLYWRVIFLPLLPIGIVLDIAFNLTIGTLAFRELPRELLFTTRCKRHKKSGRKELAEFFCRNLNLIDPGHC